MGRKRRQSGPDRGPPPGSIGQLVEYLLGRPWRSAPRNDFLAWPPDSFAVAAMLLRESGTYINVLETWPPEGSLEDYALWVNQQGETWSEQLVPGAFRVPTSVVTIWREIYQLRDRPLNDVGDLWQSLVKLCALADAASLDLLAWWTDPSKATSWQMREWIGDNIADKELVISNLCSERVARSNVCVMPKMRTPQNGITLRSMSHNVALMPTAEVVPVWRPSNLGEADRFRERMNLLVFPWPLEIYPVQFRPAEVRKGREPAEPYRYFEFRPDSDVNTAVEMVGRAYQAARQRFGRIDGVVFPEMAFGVQAFNRIIERLAWEDVAMLIGGVYEPPSDGSFGKNEARIVCFYGSADPNAPALRSYELRQQKHHRWMLDDSQIRTYGIGSMLNPRYKWWEYIDISQRTLELLQLEPSLAMAVLICEDLARPDPVGDVIRAVGPNLVIALLQDGPQLAGRWSARYATVLADDPGCSVLTLTGLGMASLSRPPGTKSSSRVVAVWKESDSAAREIELPSGADALVLCLSHDKREQWTADGRNDGRNASHITLSGVHPVSAS